MIWKFDWVDIVGITMIVITNGTFVIWRFL